MLQLAWRNLTQNRIQFWLGVGGVTLALLLMLGLDALLAGSAEDLVAYIEQAGADIFVAQEGVRNMHMAVSSITWRDLRRAARTPGATGASPILYTSGIVKAGRADVLSYIIGFDPNEPLGGPRTVRLGKTRLQRAEAIIDEAVARSQGVNLGDTVEILGEEFTVAGITRGLTNIVNSITFIRLDDFQRISGLNTLSYALVTIAPGVSAKDVAQAIMRRNDEVTALSRADFAREERQIVKDMSTELLNIMNLSGLLIGLAVTALTLYINTLRKRPEYGVLKAIGAQNGHLYAVVIVQTVLSLALGATAAIGLVWLLGWSLRLAGLSVTMALNQAGVTRVLLAALLIGGVAALTPAWQLARLDPAQVFRK